MNPLITSYRKIGMQETYATQAVFSLGTRISMTAWIGGTSSRKEKEQKGKKELKNPASLLGRKSQKAKRFGLRMVEGDIFQSEQRSSK